MLCSEVPRMFVEGIGGDGYSTELLVVYEVENYITFAHFSHIPVDVRPTLGFLRRPQRDAKSVLALFAIRTPFYQSLFDPKLSARIGLSDSLDIFTSLLIGSVSSVLPNCSHRILIEIDFLARELLFQLCSSPPE